jgi:23S rRNA (pseudouridine1915-N3)-methyltransferase
MYKIRILTVGKSKEEWLKSGIEEYTKRLSKTVRFTWILAKDDVHLENLANQETGFVCLDPHGKIMDSNLFSTFLQEQLERGGTKLTFLIGGAEGIPEQLKRNNPLISLSRMTFTHQMTRLILLEQIYRGLEIAKGTEYHKD